MSITSSNNSSTHQDETPTAADPIRRAFEVLETVSRNRGFTYRCLATFFSEPDQSLVELLKYGAIMKQLSEATAWLGEDQIILLQAILPLQTLSLSYLSTLQADYDRLLAHGVERISPCEASYRWKDTGHITHNEIDIRQALQHQYNNFGVYSDLGAEDHIAVELEFLAFLCEQEADHWASGSSQAARSLRSQQRTFCDDHISRWLPEFCYSLQHKAPHSFYGKAAILCDQWLSLDHGSGYKPITG